MTTFAIMRDRIEDEIARTNLTTQVGRAINTAIKKYERRPFYFNQESTLVLQTVGGQEYYGAADLADIPDLFRIISMRVLISDVYQRVDERPFYEVDLANTPTGYTGPPRYFTYFERQLRFSPIPDSTYTVNIAAYIRLTPSPLADDGDTNAWVTDAEELIRNAAKRDLYANVIKNHKQAGISKLEETDVFNDLRRETARKISTGTLTTDVPRRGRFNITSGYAR